MSTFYLMLLAATVAGVVALFVRRLFVMKQDFIRISPSNRREVEQEEMVREELSRIDFWGKTLTVVSAGLVVIAGLVVLLRAAHTSGLLG
jgi:hypothetical protein